MLEVIVQKIFLSPNININLVATLIEM